MESNRERGSKPEGESINQRLEVQARGKSKRKNVRKVGKQERGG